MMIMRFLAIGAAIVVSAGAADLAVTIFDTPDPVEPAQSLTYVIDVTNNGPSTAVGATMTFAVQVDGSVQNSSDRDRRWTVEVRIPFVDLKARTPGRGDVWRGNFYRYNRDHDGEAEQLSWSPTIWPGFHQPTRFGYLRFSGD